MKVLHVIPSLWSGDGGPTEALLNMERALQARGIQVETAATDHAGPGLHSGVVCGQPVEQGGHRRWYFAKRLDFYKVAPSFAFWARDNVSRFDVVHVHALFSFTSTVAARAARRAGVPYVIRPLGTLGEYGMRKRRPVLKQLSFRANEAGLLKDAAAVHFTSAQEATQAQALNVRMREAVIPLAVDAPPSPSPRDPAREPRRLLYLSRLDPKKNIEALLRAMALLRDMPRLRLAIAGGGEPGYLEALKAFAQGQGLADVVDWLGHVEGDAKEKAFDEADVFVLPSFSENFGIAAAEALARGVPCLLGEGVAIAAEAAAAHAGLATRPDAESIAAGLRLMMRSTAGLHSMSLNARRLAQERYSLQAMGNNLANLYADILAR